MKIKFAVIVAAVGYFWNCVAASPNAQCQKWECKSGLGGDKQGTQRTCADRLGEINVAETCQPDNYLCDVEQQLTTGNQTCTGFDAFPWKSNMPAGDSCGSNAECFSKNCTTINGKSTCLGRGRGEECTDDRQCNPGLYCFTHPVQQTSTCFDVRTTGQNCHGALRCEFGSLCANNVCTKFGSLPDGTIFNVTDDVLFPLPNTDARMMYWVCENFYAINTNKTSEGGRSLFECTGGPEKNFTNYNREDGNLTCSYVLTTKDGRQFNFTELAKCGFNRDTYFYCPSRRGPIEYSTHNANDRSAWRNVNATCHHRSTIQYCRDIEDNIARSLMFRNFLRTEWITSGDNWSLIANNERCVGNAIKKTRNYWRLVDSASTSYLSYLSVVAVLVSMLVMN
jgi:hypothetical protein